VPPAERIPGGKKWAGTAQTKPKPKPPELQELSHFLHPGPALYSTYC